MNRYAGIDIGSCTTKAVVVDGDDNIVGCHVLRSGVDYRSVAQEALNAALGKNWDNTPIVATGYGRHNIDFATVAKTEIACHAKGGFHYIRRALTLVDIGGQDNKVVTIDDKGHRLDFKMNRKCAAGTGTFIEEIAVRMGVPLSEMDSLARQAQKRIKIGSFCTVFASTEILSHIRMGVPVPDLVRGVFESVVDRVMEMLPTSDTVLLSGGVVEYNPIISDIFKERIKAEIIVPPHPQLTGAFGAALLAKELPG
ncbi:MAG: acyl-CoA dehydratase activase [Dehalococcoidia bacterium]